ncbi:helix-turn-helix transcriptional regulator [Chitinophaga solisilvae]|uniref:helix-turn-helix transcriptional regulator n=1 Tax=Chitinophaga solisilvae TaxID=1233460 RepID=UPI00136C8833|nr:AraC family transcriptional regulator [Chitinophaga solisilvae]
MSFHFLNETVKLTDCTAAIPPDLSAYTVLHSAAYHAGGDFGQMLFQEIAGRGFSIWYNHYQILRDITITDETVSAVLKLHFSLQNDVWFGIQQMEKIIMREMQFNIASLPAVQSSLRLSAGRSYTTFDIHFTPDYLTIYGEAFPLLARFLEQTGRGVPGMISPLNGYATPEMQGIITEILACRYTGEPRNNYIGAKTGELLLLGMIRLEKAAAMTNLIPLREDDVEKMQFARKWLHENMTTPCSLKELAHKAGTNENKLKRGFKQLFGSTVFDYLTDIRMEKALSMLFETDHSIQEIAVAIGFKSSPNFIAAFRQKYHFPPGTLKRRKNAGTMKPLDP